MRKDAIFLQKRIKALNMTGTVAKSFSNTRA